MFLGVVFFVFLLIGVHYLPGSVDCWWLFPFIRFGKLLVNISSDIFFCPILSLSSSGAVTTFILDFLVLSTGHSRLCSFFFFSQIFFCALIWIITVEIQCLVIPGKSEC